MSDKSQFREYYSGLADDELARIALSNHLVPEAQELLTDELQKRGLTDLREYKRALEEAAEASSLGRELEIQAQMKLAFAEWMLVLMAWVLAIALPFIWIASPNRSEALKVSVIGTVFIVFSGHLGLRARRRGSYKGYVLKLMFPLILLATSTTVVLSSIVLGKGF